MAIHTGIAVELKSQEHNTYYLTLETITALVNADKFIDALIILESFCQHRCRNETYEEFKHYLSGFVDFVEPSPATASSR